MPLPYRDAYTVSIPPAPGLGSVNSYLISAYPWLSGSNITGSAGEVRIAYPNVSRSFTIINTGAESIRVHFDSISNPDVVNNHHFVTLGNQGDSMVFAVRSKEFYVSKTTANLNTASFDVVVELTSIPGAEMHTISGSGINS